MKLKNDVIYNTFIVMYLNHLVHLHRWMIQICINSMYFYLLVEFICVNLRLVVLSTLFKIVSFNIRVWLGTPHIFYF